MSLILHHFSKDLRWLWPRWALFLAVLGLDLAYNMEWIFPLQPNQAYGVSDIAGGALWLVAWWVALSSPPEDTADAGRAFVWTRPLPRHAFWLARLLTWAVLIVLPMMLEVAVYLALMHRPWNEIGQGMLEELFTAGAMTLWILPAAILFRGWERYVALVIFAALWGAEYGRELLGHVFKFLGAESYQTHPFWEPLRFTWAAWLMGPLMVLLLLWHQRRPLSLGLRHALLAVLILVTYGLAAAPLDPAWFSSPTDANFVRQLTADSDPIVRPKDLQARLSTDEKLGRHLFLSANTSFDGAPRGVVPVWFSENAAATQNGTPLPMHSRLPAAYADPKCIGIWLFSRPLGRDLPSGIARDALSVDSADTYDQINLPGMPVPADLETPVDFDLHLAANWTRLRELGQAPLKPGSRIRSPEAELEVLEVRPNVGSRDEPKPGAVTLVIRQSLRSLSASHVMWPVAPILTLHAPGRRLVWQRSVHGGGDCRAMRLGWTRFLMHITFAGVMVPGSDVTEANLSQQQLIWIKPDYLGTSHHQVQVKNVSLGEETRRFGHGSWTTAAVDRRKNPRQQFLQDARQNDPPPLDAPEPEAARYVAAVYAASMAHEDRTFNNDFAEPLWPGNDREAAELIAPYLVRHPDLVGKLRWREPTDFTTDVLRAALLQARIPGFQRDIPPGQNFYQRVVAMPGKPEIIRQFSGDLWPFEAKKEQVMAAVIQMLKTGTDEAMWPLFDHEPRSLEKIWQDFPEAPFAQNLRLLSRDSRYRDKAIAEVNRQYAALAGTSKIFAHAIHLILARAVMGDAEAFGWALRATALLDDDGSSHFVNAQAFYQVFFNVQSSLRDMPEFIRNCRRWTVADFRYDADQMTWHLRTEEPPAPKKP